MLALYPGATETGFFDAVGSEEMGAGHKLSTPERLYGPEFAGLTRDAAISSMAVTITLWLK